jgi:hypothetical protein
MTFTPTSQCPKSAVGLYYKQTDMPLPHLTDEEIDTYIQAMIDAGAKPKLLPTSQIGRRVAVRYFLAGPNCQPEP